MDRWLDPSAQGFIDTDGELAPEELTLVAVRGYARPALGAGILEPALMGIRTAPIVAWWASATVKFGRVRLRPVKPSMRLRFSYIEDGQTDLSRGCARLAYRLDVNEYLGTRRLQLVVEQFRAQA